MVKYVGPNGQAEDRQPLTEAVGLLYSGAPPIQPFHWHIEFPEVFTVDAEGRPNGGFDAIVGNPPFLGGTRISTVHGMTYFQWLTRNFPPAAHLCDLVAYFFRRCYQLLRVRATMGLIATNTVAQGDTRNGGLTTICNSGGTIYNVKRRYRWPGQVSVVVCIIHIAKELDVADKRIDDKPVERISAYLFHRGGNDDPHRLCGRNALFSAGSKIYGQGFLFDDDDDEATPIAEMERILQIEPESARRVFPYMGGSELNTDPTLAPHRYVIYFSDIDDEEELARWPMLANIVREKVKPGRDALGDNPNNTPLKRRWWAYQAHRPELYAAMSKMRQVLLCSQVTPHLAFAFKNTDVIFSHKLNVFLIENHSLFAVLQSRLHDLWARFFSSTSLELLSYTPSDSFEAFPLPAGMLGYVEGTLPTTDNTRLELASLEVAGREYYELRGVLMVRNNEGLTETYNRFHDRDERSADILQLRELHAAMDRAVLEAYGWHDLAKTATCEFLLEYEDDEDDEDGKADISPSRRQKKKPWRYRWPDECRDEVLARLLALNAQRAEQERLAGEAASASVTGKARPKKGKPKPRAGESDQAQPKLFE